MITTVLSLAMALTGAQPQFSDIDMDRIRVLGSDVLSGYMVGYCRRTAPARVAAIEAAWQAWQGRSQIDAVRAALGPERVATAEAGFAEKRAPVEQKLASMGSPDTVCAQLPSTWTQSSFDMHVLYPKAYPVAAAAVSPAAATPARPAAVTASVPSGHGLKAGQIETIVSSFHWGYAGVQYTLFENGFLLLKDGTVRHNIPDVGPGDFDLAADRARNPDMWGKWQKRGDGYVFHFSADNGFVPADGAEVHGPAKAGQTLNGDYESASGYQFIGGAGSFSFHHMVFRGDGRFTRANSGFTGGTSGFGDNTVAAGTSWDDKGSATTVTGAGAGVRGGIVNNRATPDADLQGSYHIDGYELILQFDSGRRESHFFYVIPNHELIGIDDGTMTVNK